MRTGCDDDDEGWKGCAGREKEHRHSIPCMCGRGLPVTMLEEAKETWEPWEIDVGEQADSRVPGGKVHLEGMVGLT